MTILFAIFLPFLAAAFIPLLSRHRRRQTQTLHIGWFVLAIPLILFIVLATYIPQLKDGNTVIYTLEWIPSYGMNMTVFLDGLSMIFGLLITGVGSLVILYSIYYLSSKESLLHFYCYLLLFIGAMLGVVFSDNLIGLYMFWELTSVSSFLLIAFWHHRKASRAGARKAMLITVMGGVAMLAGFLMLYAASGTFSIREMIANVESIKESQYFLPAMILVLLGAFTKSAQFPFHIWLPDAMEAPTPVSAYLHSATMVKAGIYLVARLTPIFGGEATWFWAVSIVGLITLFWGSFNAVKQYDLKALLAFSTVSQLGLIMCLLGLGSVAIRLGYSESSVIYTQATFAALFHLINHSTFKGALFMMVGIVDHEVGTRDIRRLGGLMSLMPLTFTIAVIGSMSMAGLPPFNGFLSKEMFFTATLKIADLSIFQLDSIGLLFPIISFLASVLTFVYCTIIVIRTFFGKLKLDRLEKAPHEAPAGMLVSPYLLISLVFGIFLFPNIVGLYILRPAMASVYPMFTNVDALTPKIKQWHGVNIELLMTFGVVVLGILLFRNLKRWRKIYQLIPQRFTLNSYYDFLLHGGEDFSQKATKRYMNGSFTAYMSYIYFIFVALVLGFFAWSNSFSFDFSNDVSVAYYEVILAVIMAISAISILFMKSRVAIVLTTSVIGFAVAFFFVIFRAPDLALTQLVIESITTALFLLCFKFLPDLKPERNLLKVRLGKGFISILVGASVTLIGFAVLNYEKFDAISYYFEDSYNLAGGKNIVNTILGDFRAFDTMLEVVVLFIAGLGIYSLIQLKAKREGVDGEN